MKAFIDTAIFMYAAGDDHPLKGPSVKVVDGLRSGQIEGYTSTEVIQEILHRYTSIGKRKVALALSEDVIDAMSPLLVITEPIIRATVELANKYPKAQARDLVHVATCLGNGIDKIVTPDKDFQVFKELTVIEVL